MSEKISVVCPVYNNEPYLKPLINSLLFQTFEDYRVYFVNDASTDSSLELLSSIKDERFEVINNDKNLGAQKSRKKGLAHAKGEYVMLIDSDDYLELDALKKLSKMIKEEEPNLIIYDYNIISNDNRLLYTHYNSTLLYKEQFPTNVSIHPSLMLSKPGFINKCFKRSFLNEHVTFVDIRIAQDLATVPILIQEANRISYLNQSIYNYRYVKTSISHEINDKIVDVLIAIDHLRLAIKPEFSKELEFIAISHILYQMSKLSQIKDSETRHKIYNEFKEYINRHFPEYKQNQYLRKRGTHRIISMVFMNERIFFNRLFSRTLGFIKGNEFLNTTIYRFDK